MKQLGRYCPFLNRADARCSAHFKLDGLSQAYRFCFDRYKSCPLYLQLLIERRVRRSDAAERMREDAHDPIVTITISARTDRAIAHPAGLPAAPGV
ncbi:MAG TPA: hypothetical protein VF669_19405 [Tepidisphaeraceae bacterium]